MQCGTRCDEGGRVFRDVCAGDTLYTMLARLVSEHRFLEAHELNKQHIVCALNELVGWYRTTDERDITRAQRMGLANLLDEIKEAYQHKVIAFIGQVSETGKTMSEANARALYQFTRMCDAEVDKLTRHRINDMQVATLAQRKTLLEAALDTIQDASVGEA